MDSSIQNVLNTLGIRDARLIVPGHAGPAHREMRCMLDLEGRWGLTLHAYREHECDSDMLWLPDRTGPGLSGE
jgi:hypothetical protein